MNNRTVLLLDSDEQGRGTIRAMLDGAGHRVVAAASPADVITELSKQPVDVVLTNRVFCTQGPETSLLALIRAMQPRAAIVLTLRWEGASDERMPFDAVLPTPFSLLDVREVVATATAAR